VFGGISMISIEKLTKKPSLFLSFIGMSVTEFQSLACQMEEAESDYENNRLSRNNRQRAVGGGRKFTHQVPEQLLILLMYYRLYLTQCLLGFLFNVDETTIGRNIKHISPLLERFLPLPEKIVPAPTKLNTLAELLMWYPHLRVVIDATEQSIPRPKDKDKQRFYYSGKKKRHTIKTQITSNKNGIIIDTFGGVEGKRHDFRTFQDSPADKIIPVEVGFEVDRGYQGIEKVVPKRTCYQPVKASRGHPLTEYQKLINRLINRSRVLCEHVISRLKKFRILKEIFRGKLTKHPQIFKQIAGIVNLRTMNRLGLQLR